MASRHIVNDSRKICSARAFLTCSLMSHNMETAGTTVALAPAVIGEPGKPRDPSLAHWLARHS